MIKLIQYVSHPELCGQIVGQFAFMKAYSRPQDISFTKLQTLELDDVFKKADEYFIDFTSIEKLIDGDECNLSDKLTYFLSQWKDITDVTAIQQNIHYNLKTLDK